jgi:hypothetical protein
VLLHECSFASLDGFVADANGAALIWGEVKGLQGSNSKADVASMVVHEGQLQLAVGGYIDGETHL